MFANIKLFGVVTKYNWLNGQMLDSYVIYITNSAPDFLRFLDCYMVFRVWSV